MRGSRLEHPGGIIGICTSAVRWIIARGIVVAWVITLPASGAVAALCYWITVALAR